MMRQTIWSSDAVHEVSLQLCQPQQCLCHAQDISQNPFDARNSHKQDPSTSAIFPAFGFTSAAAIASTSTADKDPSPPSQPSSSPNSPVQEQDFSFMVCSWTSERDKRLPNIRSCVCYIFVQFSKCLRFFNASKGIIAPSLAALRKARQKMKEWQGADGDEPVAEESTQPNAMDLFRTASSLTSFTPPTRPH